MLVSVLLGPLGLFELNSLAHFGYQFCQFLILSTRHDERDRLFICLIAGGSAQQVLDRGCLCPKEVNSATNSEACAPCLQNKAELRGRA